MPEGEIKGWRVTRMGLRIYLSTESGRIRENLTTGRHDSSAGVPDEGTDIGSILNGFVSISVLLAGPDCPQPDPNCNQIDPSRINRTAGIFVPSILAERLKCACYRVQKSTCQRDDRRNNTHKGECALCYNMYAVG